MRCIRVKGYALCSDSRYPASFTSGKNKMTTPIPLCDSMSQEQKSMLLDLGYLLYTTKGKGIESCEKLAELFDLPSNYCEPCEQNTPSLDDICFICWEKYST